MDGSYALGGRARLPLNTVYPKGIKIAMIRSKILMLDAIIVSNIMANVVNILTIAIHLADDEA
jgi:hypothetical protein